MITDTGSIKERLGNWLFNMRTNYMHNKTNHEFALVSTAK